MLSQARNTPTQTFLSNLVLWLTDSRNLGRGNIVQIILQKFNMNYFPFFITFYKPLVPLHSQTRNQHSSMPAK